MLRIIKQNNNCTWDLPNWYWNEKSWNFCISFTQVLKRKRENKRDWIPFYSQIAFYGWLQSWNCHWIMLFSAMQNKGSKSTGVPLNLSFNMRFKAVTDVTLLRYKVWCHVDTKLHLKTSKNIPSVWFWLLQHSVQSSWEVF